MNIKEKMSSIIKTEADAIANINVTDEFEQAVEMLRQCTGKVITTGIGKAGFVAQRFAATLSSTGIPAFFIHPAEAGHGDLGMLAEDDLIVAFSTSGKSIEVVEMLEMSTQFGIRDVSSSSIRSLSTSGFCMPPTMLMIS